MCKENYEPGKLASIIYQPLKEQKASKAIAAQYAANLVESGDFGKGEELFLRLPPYLQEALKHLTDVDSIYSLNESNYKTDV